MYSLKSKHRRGGMVWIVVVGLIIASLSVAAWSVQQTYNNAIQPLAPGVQKTSIVTIKTGSSVHEIALDLSQKQIIKKSWAFEWYIRSRNVRDKLQAGSFSFKPSMSVPQIVDVITGGKVATDLFTILPAQRLDQVQASFVKAGYTQAAVDAAFMTDQYSTHPALTDKPKGASLEGYLYPESFQKTADTTPQTIIKASLDEMAKALSPEVRAGITKQGLTVHQGVILASIVEKEVSSTADRAKVVQVFLKRIKLNMQLGSDVTAYYGADVAGMAHSVLSDTVYNTRLHNGLPPGPIGNVSSSSLKAVASPAPTDYLFFVAGDDGVTYFSNTVKEHEALTAQHCQKLCQE
jgi:UPF0755 protein